MQPNGQKMPPARRHRLGLDAAESTGLHYYNSLAYRLLNALRRELFQQFQWPIGLGLAVASERFRVA